MKFKRFIYCFTFVIFVACNMQTRDVSYIIHIGTLHENLSSFDTILSNIEINKFDIHKSDTLRLYFFQGKIKQISVIDFKNRINGRHIEFRQNGNLYFTGNYRGGIPHGLFKRYDSLGRYSKAIMYVNGEKSLR